MENIYQDITARTGSDIYVGVVGPVRVGKSSFITRFMEEFVIPKMAEGNAKMCTIDELPQSADGKTIMTTQPKFVPSDSVLVETSGVKMNMRLVDCVGYFADGAEGDLQEDGKQRMVKTPWSAEKMPLKQSAEIGTRKVVEEHSTIAILMTSDASFGDLPRKSFVAPETRLVKELKDLKKPFVIALNSKEPNSQKTLELAKSLEEKHGVPVVPLDATKMDESDISRVFEKMLSQFPLVCVELKMPDWLTSLPFEHEIIQEIVCQAKNVCKNAEKMGDFSNASMFLESQHFEKNSQTTAILGEGKVEIEIKPKPNLFYEVLSQSCGFEIENDFDLAMKIKDLAKAKLEFSKLENALKSVNETGYGIVVPNASSMKLDVPEVARQGAGKFGVKLRATAPSLHIMRVDLETEISPMVGNEEQAKDLVTFLQEQEKNEPNGMWDTSIFGKSVQSLMTEGLSKKLDAMPVEAQKKMRKTLTRIVNEGKGGIICILL